MAKTITDQQRRALRQHLSTTILMGVDYLPIGRSSGNHLQSQSAESIDSRETQARLETVSHVEIDASMKQADPNDPAALLEALRAAHDAVCPHCTAVSTHTQTVFGEGNPRAEILFIGESPGEEEDKTGRPFVGRAGQKLTDIIHAMGLSREEVYIANVLKSRPPNNRTPQPDEVERCSPFLVQQIRIIRPQVIVTLGGPATKLILDTNIGITRLRGIWAEYNDAEAGLTIPVMPTFHPAYLLRNYTKDTRQKVWSDMRAVLERLGRAPRDSS